MMNFQDANSPSMENILFFNDYSMLILLMIITLIIYMMLSLLTNKLTNKFISQNQIIEMIWTFIPLMILICMAIPSLNILYLTEEISSPTLTIKSISHQWYWNYEYADFNNINFDSFMINSLINQNSFRLLDVDNHMIIPFKSQIRLLTNSHDVIHSWTIPSLGIKMDSIPGRINQSLMTIMRPGIYYGQCSEICGMNHSFMPIVIESTSNKNFILWIKSI
uniref:Cytochrome c oxidase subunit 2 n=1 Tax=Hypsicera sp. ZJUH_2016019 TaxID=2491161 RepID=A0A3S8V0U5_9HYME|nr:cytochrome c oxidase subunit 2 [Hypsicera sp. ZJUH_2016019]